MILQKRHNVIGFKDYTWLSKKNSLAKLKVA